MHIELRMSSVDSLDLIVTEPRDWIGARGERHGMLAIEADIEGINISNPGRCPWYNSRRRECYQIKITC